MDNSDKFLITTNTDECVDCSRCILHCPIKYSNKLRIDNHGERKICVDSQYCINCGICLKSCIHGARSYNDDFDRFTSDLQVKKDLNVILDPSIIAIKKNDVKRLIGYLKLNGIKNVYDGSFGADIATWCSLEYFKRNNPSHVLISQACHVVVDYISKYKPDLIDYMLPLQPPAFCEAIYIKKYLKQTAPLALISTCIVKKKEASLIQNQDLLEYNISIENLDEKLKEMNIDLSDYPEMDFDDNVGGLGRLFSQQGGFIECLKHHNPDLNIKRISTPQSFIEYLDNFQKDKNIFNEYDLIDMVNCEFGCNLGPASNLKLITSKFNSKTQEELLAEERATKKADLQYDEEKYKGYFEYFSNELDLDDFVTYIQDESQSLSLKEPTEEELDKIFNRLGKYTEKEKNINCTACGYESCREFAKVIFNGQNNLLSCHKYREKLIKEDSQRISMVIKAIDEAIIVTDEHKIIEHLGLSKFNIINFESEKYIKKPISELFAEYKLDTLKNGDSCEIKTTDVNDKVLEFKVTCKIFETKLQTKYLYVFQDITLPNLTKQIQENIISIISHDLRTPLTSIKGSLELLLGGSLGILPQKVTDLLKIANNNSIRLTNVVNEMLDIEKIKTGKVEFHLAECDVQKTIQSIVDINTKQAKENDISLTFNNTAENAKINVDKNKFIQIISNVIAKAIQYSKKDSVIELSVYREDNSIITAISDKNIVIPKELEHKIFETFLNLKDSKSAQNKETEIGLSICKYYVEQMQGQIYYKSSEEYGTTFFIKFPEIFNIETKPKVLICEDMKITAKMLSVKFQKLGYEVDIATTGKEALNKINESHYDLMSLDLILPDMGGLDLLKEIKHNKNTANLPIIVSSSTKKDMEIVKAFNIVGWYEKSFNANDLQNIVDKIVNESKMKKYNILYFEENTELVQVLETAVKDFANVLVTNDFYETEQIILNNKLDLAIFDYKVNDDSYTKAIDIMRQHKPTTPRIVFSDYEVPDDIRANVDVAILKTETSNNDLLSLIDKFLKKTENQ